VTNENREPIELAQVFVEGQLVGTRCDFKGFYEISFETADTVTVAYSMMGYQTRKRKLAFPKDTIVLNIMLPSLGYELGEVQIKDIRKQTSSMTDVNINSIKHMGNASGGGIESIIATQAGVSTHNELSSQYNVRGGSFDENSVYINGIEVYRPLLIRSGQQEGLSVINPDMVERVGFSAGGYDAKYGDKMSSVLDIQYKKVNGYEGSVSGSLLGASAYVGFGKENFSLTNALRYKTTTHLLGTLDTKGEYKPVDFDYQAYLNWQPSQRWEIDFIGNISRNNYDFIPSDRTTKFGTAEDVKEFKVYFDGQEKDYFHTYFGALSLTHKFNKYNKLALNLSMFETHENETFDISGEYWLNNDDAESSLGIGKYMEHARNNLTANVTALSLSGNSKFTSHNLQYGIMYKSEKIREHMREWEMRDSSGYSLPNLSDRLELIYNLSSSHRLVGNRLEMYLQDTYRNTYSEGELVINYGARLSHWSVNGEWLFSPRATFAFTPSAMDNLTLRFSTGLYYQSPFYKELKDTVSYNGNTSVELNKNIKSQKSIHFVLAGEYKFKVNNRPFKATAELYYKHLSDLIPYNINNVRLNYYGGNISKGYAAGLDMKIYGEFVPGTDSWISVGLMKAEEEIDGCKVPRPTDQRLNLSVFFSDYFPNTDRWKVTVKGHYAGGLPFGPPHSGREEHVFRMPSYRRVDLGMSYRLFNNEERRYYNSFLRYIKNVWIGIDAFNILDISNVNSYYWVTDVNNVQFAVPNYLTGRQLNFRFMCEF
jgi:hypothetical protein